MFGELQRVLAGDGSGIENYGKWCIDLLVILYLEVIIFRWNGYGHVFQHLSPILYNLD